MPNSFQYVTTGNGINPTYTMPFTMDADLTMLDVTVTLGGNPITNFTKTSTTQLTFTAPYPNGSLVFERNTRGARRYAFVPGTRIFAQQVSDELNRGVACAAEDDAFSWRNYTTAGANGGKTVQISADGTHEVLVTPTVPNTGDWANPGTIGSTTPNTVKATTLEVTGATTLDASVVLAGTQDQKDNLAAQLGWNIGGVVAKNAIRNGDFRLWRRQSSGTPSKAYSTNIYEVNFDGWFYYSSAAPTPATCTVSKQIFTLGQTTVPGHIRSYARYVTTVPASTSYLIGQRIQGVEDFSGESVYLSFYAKADANRTLPFVQLTESFGTGGSPSGDVSVTLASNVAIASSWARYSWRADLPSVAGKTMGSTGLTDYLQLSITLPTVANTFEITGVQIERASLTQTAPTAFDIESRQSQYQKCNYYGRPLNSQIRWYNATAVGGSMCQSWDFGSNPMRATPIRLSTDPVTGSTSNVGVFSPAAGAQFGAAGDGTGVAFAVRSYVTAAAVIADTYVIDYVFFADAEL